VCIMLPTRSCRIGAVLATVATNTNITQHAVTTHHPAVATGWFDRVPLTHILHFWRRRYMMQHVMNRGQPPLIEHLLVEKFAKGVHCKCSGMHGMTQIFLRRLRINVASVLAPCIV